MTKLVFLNVQLFSSIVTNHISPQAIEAEKIQENDSAATSDNAQKSDKSETVKEGPTAQAENDDTATAVDHAGVLWITRKVVCYGHMVKFVFYRKWCMSAFLHCPTKPTKTYACILEPPSSGGGGHSV